MSKSYDLRREIVVSKFQLLLDLVSNLDGNTDEIEAKLNSIITILTSIDTNDFATETTLLALEATANSIETILTSIDSKDFATETTLAAIKAKTDQLTFTGNNLNVNASVTLPPGLATEAKQDVQITNQGTDTASPPFGTKIIGWLQSIWNEISGQTNTLENNEENTFNINEKIIVDTDDDSIAVNQVLPTNINLLYGWEEQEGGVWERIHTDTEGRLKVRQDFQPLPIGAATENTLLGVKGKTDQFTFTNGNLNVNASVTLAGESAFGDNAAKTTVALSDVSATILAANTNRKQAVIVNTTNKAIWICYGTPATYGGGIPLFKDDILIEDRYRGIITGIMNTGETGNIQVTEVTL